MPTEQLKDPTIEELIEGLFNINGGGAVDLTPIPEEQIKLLDNQIAALENCKSETINIPFTDLPGTERFIDEDAVMIAGTEAFPAPRKQFIYAINGQYVTKEEWEAAQAEQIEAENE